MKTVMMEATFTLKVRCPKTNGPINDGDTPYFRDAQGKIVFCDQVIRDLLMKTESREGDNVEIKITRRY